MRDLRVHGDTVVDHVNDIFVFIIANILFDAMKIDSNNFPFYAEYVRKSLLRLSIVKGLLDDLKTTIVIRGITDPQIKANTSNG